MEVIFSGFKSSAILTVANFENIDSDEYFCPVGYRNEKVLDWFDVAETIIGTAARHSIQHLYTISYCVVENRAVVTVVESSYCFVS